MVQTPQIHLPSPSFCPRYITGCASTYCFTISHFPVSNSYRPAKSKLPTQSLPCPVTRPPEKRNCTPRIHCRPVNPCWSQNPTHSPEGNRSSVSFRPSPELGRSSAMVPL